MAKKNSVKRNKKAKAPAVEVLQVVPDIENGTAHDSPNDHEVPELGPDVDAYGFYIESDPIDGAANDDSVVPQSPVMQPHGRSGDTDEPKNKPLTKEQIGSESRLTKATGAAHPTKAQTDKQRPTENTSNLIKKTAPPQIKHSLQDSWVFWYYQGDKKKSWQDNLLPLWEFDTVEDFWSMYNYTVQPSNLQPGRDFNLFKKGIRPEWEDRHNMGGGVWSVTLRERRMRSPEMDAVWIEVAMLLIGDQFDHLASYVNGATYSARKNQDRVQVWVAADLDRQRDTIQVIGERLRKAVQFAGSNFVLEYATSDDWKNKAGPTVNARIVLHMQ